MRDFMIVTKLLFKANYTIDLKSKKGKQSILIGALLLLCMLPTITLVYFMFYSSLKSLNLDLMILEFGFGAICFFVLWTALFLFPSIFYFSNDISHLLVYPISPTTIVSAKFVVVYASLLLTSTLISLPILVAYINAGATLAQIVFFILQIPLISLVPAFLTSIFWLVILRLLPFFHNKDRFNLITGILSIVIAIGIGAASGTLSGSTSQDPQALINMLQNNPETFSILNKIFFNVPFIARSIVNTSFIDLLIHIVLIIITGGTFFLCAKHLYLVAALNSKGNPSKRKKELKNIHQNDPLWSYFKADFFKLIRTPAYFSNCVLSSLVGPIIILIIFLTMPNIDEAKEILKSLDITQFINLPLYLYLGGMVMGFLFGSMNGICATAFSREGKNIAFLLYIPIKFSKQILVKTFLGIMFSVITCLFFLIPLHIFLRYPIYYDLAFILGSLITTIFINQIALIIDGIHPKLNWEDETSAIKNNLNVMFELLFSWALLALLTAPLFLFNLYDHLEIYAIFISILLIILILIIYIISPKFILKHLKKAH